MSTVAFTTTESETQPSFLPTQEDTDHKQLKKLETIMNTEVKRWEKKRPGPDEMTKSILNWAISSMNLYLENETLESNPQELSSFLLERIQVLGNEVLVDPVFKQPLLDSTCEDGWVLGKLALTELKRLFPTTSPFTKKSWELTPASHLLVQTMLDWAKESCTLKSNSASAETDQQSIREGVLCCSSSSPQEEGARRAMDQVRIFFISRIISELTRTRIANQQSEIEEDRFNDFVEETERTQAEIHKTVNQTKEETEKIAAFAKEHIESMKKSHATQMDEFEGRYAAIESRCSHTIGTLMEDLATKERLLELRNDAVEQTQASLRATQDSLEKEKRENARNKQENAANAILIAQFKNQFAQIKDKNKSCSTM